MKAVILSAGRGSRLLPRTENCPKCLLRIGTRTVIEHQLQVIIDCGIRDIVVVTGFQTDLVEDVIEKWRTEDVRIAKLFNPFFEVADNLASCWMARSHMNGEFVLLNGDTMFEPDVLRRLLASPPAPVTMTIDRKDAYDADDMKVELDRDQVMAVAKDLPRECVSAASIGLLYFRSKGARLFVQALDHAMRGPQGLQWWFLKAVDDLAKVKAVAACSIEGLDWAELDTPADLETVRSLFG